LIGHVYSLVHLVMADHRLARQMLQRYCIAIRFSIIVWHSWFRCNRHFAFCLCITQAMVHSDSALHVQTWYSTLAFCICDYYQLVDRELPRSFLVDPSRRQVGHPWNRLSGYINLHNLHNTHIVT